MVTLCFFEVSLFLVLIPGMTATGWFTCSIYSFVYCVKDFGGKYGVWGTVKMLISLNA